MFGTSCVLFAGLVACSDDPLPRIAKVFIETSLSPGSNPASGCPVPQGDWLVVGKPSVITKDNVLEDGSIEDGKAFNGSSVSVTCSVRPKDDGFEVSATTTLGGVQGGTFTVSGMFRPTKAPQTGIRGRFKRGDIGDYKDTNCTVVYEEGTQQGVFAGRVWGTITCEKAERDDLSKQSVCQAVGEFKFENCSE